VRERTNGVLLRRTADGTDDLGAVSDGHLDGDRSDSAGGAVYQDGKPSHQAVGEQGSITGDAGDSQAGSLFEQVCVSGVG
jgi:hypothetical protein